MVIETRCQGFSLVFFLPPARQSDYADSGATWLFADSLASLVTVQLGQTDVEQDGVRLKSQGLLDGGLAIVGDVDRVAQQSQRECQHAGGILVVVHDQNAASLLLGSRLSGGGGGGSRECDEQRNPYDEFTPLAETFTSRFDASAVHFDQSLDQGQADAQTALRAFECRRHLREHLKQLRKMLSRYPDAGIADGDDRITPLALGVSVYLAALVSKFANT
jgi:hypothetical protein